MSDQTATLPPFTPLSVDLSRLRAHAGSAPHGFILESGPREAGWQFLGFEPRWLLTSRGQIRRLWKDGRATESLGPALEALREALAQWRAPALPDAPPFWGGAVGFLGYDLAWQLERLPRRGAADTNLPEMAWGFYDAVVAVPPQGAPLLCVSAAPGEDDEQVEAKRAKWLERLEGLSEPRALMPAHATGPAQPNLGPSAYRKAVGKILDHIRAGDLYQANLSQRFEIPVIGSAYAWFEALVARNPAPFAAYLNLAEASVVSVSPERYLSLRGGRVVTQPIKGTRPRGADPETDRAQADELLASAKDRAEHLMIVDLERNDLGRVCVPGSVTVSEGFTLEAHPTVWHLVSTVEGRLRPGADAVELIAATFPGGSITGAPKIRAIEVLAGLEPTRRGLYTGAIGYLGRDGSLDLNIAIRTAIAQRHRVLVQVGGGIVADSDPDAEYQETLDKAAAFLETLGATLA
jgi:para-aminobenzoate synthetase component 1